MLLNKRGEVLTADTQKRGRYAGRNTLLVYYGLGKHSTVQYSTVQYSTVQYLLTLMLMESVSIMVRRSMPIPKPPVGGRPSLESRAERLINLNPNRSAIQTVHAGRRPQHYREAQVPNGTPRHKTPTAMRPQQWALHL